MEARGGTGASGAAAVTGQAAAAGPAYAVVIEQADGNWSAYVPDLPGCVSTGATPTEVIANIREAIELHIEGMIEDGEPVPPPRTLATMVGIQSPGAGELTVAGTGAACAERDRGDDTLGRGALASIARVAGWRDDA